MLKLTRKRGEVIQIGEVFVTIGQIRGNKVSIGIEAPKEISIRRGELPEVKLGGDDGASEDKYRDVCINGTPEV